MRLRALITAGGTTEAIDDVRGVTNVSTGRFGAALARALHARGVEVTVIGSAAALDAGLPAGVRRVPFRGHVDLDAALAREAARPPDLLLMAAAVSDYAPRAVAGKIRSDHDGIELSLERVPKILPTLRDRFPGALLVGFKLLSGVPVEALLDAANRQRAEARVDLVVANDLAELHGGRHPVWLVGGGHERLDGARDEVADQLAERFVAAVARPAARAAPPWTEAEGPVRGRLRRWVRLPVAWAPPLPPHAPDEAVARLVAEPWRTLALREGRGVRLGAGEHDLDLAAAGWAGALDALADLDGPTLPIVDDGVLVAAARLVDGGVALAPTGLGDDDVWPQRVLPQHAGRAWWVPEAQAHAWTDRGFAVVDRRVGRLVTRAPWDRDDAVLAASACLYDRPTRTVLVGERLRAPSEGRIAFPGGRVEPGEDPLDAVRRELWEETGLVAPAAPPAMLTTTWRGRVPTWRVTTGVWSVPVRQAGRASDEMDATWRPLDEVVSDPRTLPGVRAVLTELRLREELGWTPG